MTGLGSSLAVLVALLVPGCDADGSSVGDTEPQLVSLVSHQSWMYAELANDVAASHQPASVDCGIAGFFVENGTVEMDTNRCNYVLIEHPAAVSVPAGSEVRISLQHFDLMAPEPATAHIAISFRDAGESGPAEMQWETTIDVPASANVIVTSWTTTRALDEGDSIQIHLHNHGQNNYQLVRMAALLQR